VRLNISFVNNGKKRLTKIYKRTANDNFRNLIWIEKLIYFCKKHLMKTIVLLRHSYTENHHTGKDDFYRHLTPKGIKVAKLMGHELKKQISNIDLIISSSAIRTRETTEILKKEVFPETTIRFEKDLYYLQFTNLFFDFIYSLNESVKTVLFVGHNPVFSFLAQSMSDNPNLYFHPGSFLVANFQTKQWTEINHGIVADNVIFADSKLIYRET